MLNLASNQVLPQKILLKSTVLPIILVTNGRFTRRLDQDQFYR